MAFNIQLARTGTSELESRYEAPIAKPMEELKHHGYRIGPGTLYPLLHGMERDGLHKSELKNITGRRRRLYKITVAGRRALKKAKALVDELHHELHEEHPRRVSELNITDPGG